MQRLVFTNGGGQTIDLTSGNFGITNWEGLSNTGLNIQTQQVPFQDGGVFLDALMEQREISVTVAIQDNNDLSLRYELKRQLISALNPKLGEGVLVYTNDYLSRQIKAVPQLPIFENKNSNDAGTLKASVVFSCPSPYWEDLEDTVVQFSVGNIAVINNEGDVPAQVEMIVSGNVTNPKIINKTTGKSIEYNNTLTSQLHINTNIGKKEVYTTKGLNFQPLEWSANINSIRFIEEYNQFFGVTSQGEIISSYDGLDWEIMKVTSNKLYDIAYSGSLGLFVVVGENILVTGTDGENWETDIFGISDDSERIIWVDELQIFVLASFDSIYTSSNGLTFTQKHQEDTWGYSDVVYSKKLGMIVAVNGVRYTRSTDGETWTTAIDPSGYGVVKLVYSEQKEKFVAVGHLNYSTSTDGINWTSDSFVYGADSIVYDRTLELFVLTGTKDYSYMVATSPDGITWTDCKEISGVIQSTYHIAYSYELNILCIGGQFSSFFTTSNLTTWNERKNLLSAYTLYGIASKQNLKVAVGNVIAISGADGNWTIVTTPEHYLNDIVYDGTRFIAVGDYGLIMTSSDGVHWTTTYTETDGDLNAITYNNYLDLYIAVGLRPDSESGEIYTSSDLQTWTRQTITNGSGRLYAVVGGHDMTVAVGEGSVATSQDGRTWTGQWFQGIGEEKFSGVAYNGKFVIVGEDYYGISEDGITWTLTRTEGFDMNKVKFIPWLFEFIAVGDNGNVRTSFDGENWELQNVSGAELYNICFDSSNILIAGEKGTIIYVQAIESENEKQNVIQYLTQDSDIGFNLTIGKNKIYLNRTIGNFSLILSYRQKYIGV